MCDEADEVERKANAAWKTAKQDFMAAASQHQSGHPHSIHPHAHGPGLDTNQIDLDYFQVTKFRRVQNRISIL